MTQLFPEMAEAQRIDALIPAPPGGGAGDGA